MSFYDEMQDLSVELFTEFDQGAIRLRVYSNDSTIPTRPNPVYTPIKVEATANGVSAEHLKDTAVLASDLVVSMPGIYTPKSKDELEINGRNYSIIKLTPKPAAGTVAAWELVVRA